jgi:RHS repeat-associated protein
VKSPWTFSCQRYDEATSLYRFVNRDYDSSIGRWLTPDPLGFADGPNLYAYVHNNLLIYVDPYGLWATEAYYSVRDGFSSVVRSPRFHGACQMAAGVGEVTVGHGISVGSYGSASPIGLAVAAHGADQFCAGFRKFVNGRDSDTATSQIMQTTGMSKNTANTTDNFISILGAAGGPAAMGLSIPKLGLPPLMNTAGISCNRAVFERYRVTLRANMEKPYVQNLGLQKKINEIYRPNARIGSGSTAAAIRHELATGEKVGSKYHSQKGRDLITSFEGWLKNNLTARQGDRAAVENIIKDTRNALGE